MREVEPRLTEQAIPIVVLAREVYAVEEPTRAHIEAVRRACGRLVELGRAERPIKQERVLAWDALSKVDRRVLPRHQCAWVRAPLSADVVEQRRLRANAIVAERRRWHLTEWRAR
jgi:hypothetical protein